MCVFLCLCMRNSTLLLVVYICVILLLLHRKQDIDDDECLKSDHRHALSTVALEYMSMFLYRNAPSVVCWW